MHKSTAWYIKFPWDPYALGPVRFATPVTERDAREWAREWEWEGCKTLPEGFECWPAE